MKHAYTSSGRESRTKLNLHLLVLLDVVYIYICIPNYTHLYIIPIEPSFWFTLPKTKSTSPWKIGRNQQGNVRCIPSLHLVGVFFRDFSTKINWMYKKHTWVSHIHLPALRLFLREQKRGVPLNPPLKGSCLWENQWLLGTTILGNPHLGNTNLPSGSSF